jgi:HSP20 family protein
MVQKTDHSGFWPSLYDPFRSFGTRISDWLSPAAEASEGNGSYSISMEVPGINESDIDLTVADDVVTVRGEKKTNIERSGDTWFFSERQYGAFRRSFQLPADADGDGVKAEMKDGVLYISVPKSKADALSKAKRVEIAQA